MSAPAFDLPQALDYVHAASRLAGLSLHAARADAVAGHLHRTAALARLLEQPALAPEDEPAELYCPAPYPVENPV
jgi:hypothetical protein